jgi:endogenous inhibitor of DNA gyrase (YacG/DUF329 family)
MIASLRIKCPSCRKEGEWFATPYGPFCSKRCKLVDLGQWLNEEHKLSRPLDEEEKQPAGPDTEPS